MSVAGIGPNLSLAQTYDDPAVAICEFQIKRDLKPEWIYERRSASVEEATATISFGVSILNTRPYEKTVTCPFRLEGKRFFLAKPELRSERECDAALKVRLERQQKRGWLHADDSVEYDDCMSKVRAANFIASANPLLDDAAASQTGIYPIDPDRTELKAE